MDRARLEAIREALPVFPLPRVVLMPGALLPLHVFEPRYRALVTHCLDTEPLMGVATLVPGYEDDYYGDPPMHAEIGVGEVVAHQPFPDGRCNIVLQYVGRVQMEEELVTPHPFRVVSATIPREDASGVDAALVRLKVLVLQLGAVSPGAAEEARRLVALDGLEMVHSLARKLLEDPDEQRSYLSAEHLVEHIEAVEDRLARFLAAPDPFATA